MNKVKEEISVSLERVEKWVESSDYKGYEPFDGLESFLSPLTFGNWFLQRVLIQLVRQSPINIRPLLGVKPLDSTIGRGYMAWGYITLLKLTGIKAYEEKAISCFEWLSKNKAPGYKNFAWGKHFDYAGRGGRYPKLEPITVWTSLIGQAYLDGYEVLGEKEYLGTATSICEWILGLPREKTDSGTCLSYLASVENSIHNSNMLGAAMLARTAKFSGNGEYLKVAKEAMEYSCSRQLSEGGWYYGEDRKNHWIDNFHTGYNLDSLKCYIDNTGDVTYNENLRRGFRYYMDNFFEENGRPKYYHNRVYPVDIQCASQAITTLSCFSEEDDAALPLALKVATWTIDNMQDKKGYFFYRQYPLLKAGTPMLHWGQATMYKALADLLAKMSTS